MSDLLAMLKHQAKMHRKAGAVALADLLTSAVEALRLNKKEITALRAEVERLRKDAERYRWLRGRNALTEDDDQPGPFVVDETSYMVWYPADEELDDAIDAAIAEASEAQSAEPAK